MDKLIALSNIVQTGTTFEVVAPTKNTTFGIGTKGVVSYVEGYDKDFKNVVYYKVIIMRRGKAGKKRIELKQISMPIFIPKCSNLKYILPKANHKHFVFADINRRFTEQNILEFDNHLFLAWTCAYGKYLYKLHSVIRKIKIWPKDKNHILNTINNIQRKFTDNQTDALNTYTSNKFRKLAITEIRLFEATLSGCVIDYLYKLANLEKNAISTIISNYKKIRIKDVSLYKQFLELTVKNKIDVFDKILKIRKREDIKLQKPLVIS